MKIWDAECKESTATVCSAVYWTSEKKGESALGVNFLNGYVVPKEVEAFAYARCLAGKKARRQAEARPPRAKAGKKKSGNASSGVIDLVRNYLPKPDGPRLEEKIAVMITGAGGSASAASWEVKKKGAGLFSARAAAPVDEGEMVFTFSVNYAKKTVLPADARAKAVFKAILDPEVTDGEMR